MNTDVSGKPADWLFRKETKAADFSVTSVAKVSRPTLLILIFTSEGTWNLFLPLRLNKETVNIDNTVVLKKKHISRRKHSRIWITTQRDWAWTTVTINKNKTLK